MIHCRRSQTRIVPCSPLLPRASKNKSFLNIKKALGRPHGINSLRRREKWGFLNPPDLGFMGH
jgi:hypothetical protein